MVLEVHVILHDRRIARKVVSHVRVAAEEASEVRHVIVHGIAIAGVFRPVEAIFFVHKSIRILLQLIAYTRIVLVEILQGRVVLDELAIVGELRIAAKLLADFTVTIEESVEVREVSPVTITIAITHTAVAVAILGISLIAIFLVHERVRILLQLIAHSRMVAEIISECRVVLHKFAIVCE